MVIEMVAAIFTKLSVKIVPWIMAVKARMVAFAKKMVDKHFSNNGRKNGNYAEPHKHHKPGQGFTSPGDGYGVSVTDG